MLQEIKPAINRITKFWDPVTEYALSKQFLLNQAEWVNACKPEYLSSQHKLSSPKAPHLCHAMAVALGLHKGPFQGIEEMTE